MRTYLSIALLVALTSGCETPPEDVQVQRGADAAGLDPLQLVSAPGRVPVCADAKVGWMAERTMEAGGTTRLESYAVVGDAGDSWRIETGSFAGEEAASTFPELAVSIMGLTVRKSDGVVTRAVLGKPGFTGREVKIARVSDLPVTAPTQAGTPDRVAIAIGTFDAMKTTTGDTTSWVGTSGKTDGVLLKVQGGGQDYELAEMPTVEAKDVDGVAVQTTKLVYTNGMKQWSTHNEIITCMFNDGHAAPGKRRGFFRLEVPGMVVNQVTAIRTDAQPQLRWE